jgi:biotin carboxyl carrier protein
MQHDEIDFDEIISNYKADPYDYVDIHSVHTGHIRFKVEVGSEVIAVSGEWHHIPGTTLYVLNRERNPKPVHSPTNGEVSFVRKDLDGQFVEAGEKIVTIKHPLTKREIIDGILRKVLYPFVAPERAKYFFSMDIQSRIDKYGQRQVYVQPGDEILTMSLMKRETPIFYEGEPGIIHSSYFQPGESVDLGQPLIGICPKDRLPRIQKIITRVKAEWG